MAADAWPVDRRRSTVPVLGFSARGFQRSWSAGATGIQARLN